MVKKHVVINEERDVCDYCGDEHKVTYNPCPICGKAACWECKQKYFMERTAEMHVSSSGNKFCNECIANPPERFKKLMSLYDEMDALEKNEIAFYKQQKETQKELEENIRNEKKKVFPSVD